MMMLMFTLGMSAQTIVERVAFQATLNGKIPVRVAFEVDAEKTAAGEIYYPKAKNPAPILIVGYKMPDGDYYLREFNSKGEVTGIVHVERKAGKFSGYWTNPRTEEGLRFTNLRTIAFPKACGGKLLPEDPAHIGREYRYSFYHTGMKEMMGGTATFKGAGKNRIHFDICNHGNRICNCAIIPGMRCLFFVYRQRCIGQLSRKDFTCLIFIWIRCRMA